MGMADNAGAIVAHLGRFDRRPEGARGRYRRQRREDKESGGRKGQHTRTLTPAKGTLELLEGVCACQMAICGIAPLGDKGGSEMRLIEAGRC